MKILLPENVNPFNWDEKMANKKLEYTVERPVQLDMQQNQNPLVAYDSQNFYPYPSFEYEKTAVNDFINDTSITMRGTVYNDLISEELLNNDDYDSFLVEINNQGFLLKISFELS